MALRWRLTVSGSGVAAAKSCGGMGSYKLPRSDKLEVNGSRWRLLHPYDRTLPAVIGSSESAAVFRAGDSCVLSQECNRPRPSSVLANDGICERRCESPFAMVAED